MALIDMKASVFDRLEAAPDPEITPAVADQIQQGNLLREAQRMV
jgi:hypothetical protein